MKNILITGGSSGIGLATAEFLLNKEDYNVISVSRSKEKIQRAIKEKPELKRKLDIIFADISKNSDCIKVFEYVKEKYKKLDGLVNNAGIISKGGLIDTDEQEWQNILDVNLKAPFILIKALLPLLKNAEKSSIVNVSSIASQKPGTSLSYSVSKAGLDMLTLFLAGELGKLKIRVNAVNPGLVRTNLHFDNKITENQEDYEEMLRKSTEKYPIGRIGNPEEIAELIAFLLSEKSSWITGSIIRIDGGASVYNDLIRNK